MCFRKVFCFFIGILWSITGHAQDCESFTPGGQWAQYAYQVSFTDKYGSPPLSDSLQFLSPRAFARRAAQGLSVDSTDRPVSPLYIDSVLTATNGILHITSKWLNLCVILVTDTSAIPSLRSKPYINGIKLVGLYSTILHNKASGAPYAPITPQGQLTPIIPALTSSYYGTTYQQTALVHGDYLHSNGYQGQGKLIAVLDAGFIGADTGADEHRGLDSLWYTGGFVDAYNFTLDTSYVFGYDTHGLSSLSTMAGYLPGITGSNGYVGSAPLAQYALYVTEDNLSEQPVELDNLVAGAERADSVGADVITVSLGYDTFCGDLNADFVFATDFDGKSTVAARGANLATKKGILFVASAGNEGDGEPGFGHYILTPGDADSAITIGAVDITGVNPSFSGYGPNAAGQVKPDVCLLGVAVSVFDDGSRVFDNNGTSFATPQLAGWAACLWQAAGPATTPYMLRNAINRSANHYTSPGQQMGYGIPNFQKAFQTLSIQDTPHVPGIDANWVVAEGNPFTNTIGLAVKVPADEDVDFILTDISGKKIMTSTQTFYTGWNPRITLPVPASLPAGIYILHAISATQQQVLKLVKE